MSVSKATGLTPELTDVLARLIITRMPTDTWVGSLLVLLSVLALRDDLVPDDPSDLKLEPLVLAYATAPTEIKEAIGFLARQEEGLKMASSTIALTCAHMAAEGHPDAPDIDELRKELRAKAAACPCDECRAERGETTTTEAGPEKPVVLAIAPPSRTIH